MGIGLFLNDYYDLLKLMHDNEVIILDEKVIPLTQQQIATDTTAGSNREESRRQIVLS